MKVPFRCQASEYDCVPTTMVNALSYLYERNEIPPLAIQRIYMYCLDSSFNRNNLGNGTSKYAVQMFGNLLNEFRWNSFENEATYIRGNQVNIGRIGQTLLHENCSVALLRVKSTGRSWHYILGLSLDDEWLYAFDPYPKRNRNIHLEQYEFMAQDHGQSPNLKINRQWLNSRDNHIFQFGTNDEREALLIQRL